MLLLVLGKGKTGSIVAQVARERGHSVRVLDFRENTGASALTAPSLCAAESVPAVRSSGMLGTGMPSCSNKTQRKRIR